LKEHQAPSFGQIEGLAHRRYDEMKASEALNLAKQLGTLNADDRSKQYPIDDVNKLKEAVNLALTKARRCERLNDEKDREIIKLRRELRWCWRLILGTIFTGFVGLAFDVCAHYLTK
jgi:hypothetical protein